MINNASIEYLYSDGYEINKLLFTLNTTLNMHGYGTHSSQFIFFPNLLDSVAFLHFAHFYPQFFAFAIFCRLPNYNIY